MSLVSGEQTGGTYSILEVWGPQGFATPLHVHRDVDEGFYVIEANSPSGPETTSPC